MVTTVVDVAEYMREVPRVDQEKAGRIRTFTGKLVNPLDMQPEDFDIRDIAHHLSNLCRYTGAVPTFYSVAQHSVIVARYFLKKEERLAGLLHDAAEAYINDLSSPLKKSDPFKFYRELDNSIVERCYLAFGLSPALFPAVKQFDDLTYFREVASFWPKDGDTTADDQYIHALTPIAAEKLFLKTFGELHPGWSPDGLQPTGREILRRVLQ